MTKAAPKAREDAPDWPSIEPHWRAGIKTKKELAEDFGVSRAAMDKHFAKLGIERDLLPKIQARAREIVEQEVTQRLHETNLRVTEPVIVEQEATTQALAIRRHSRGIATAWRTVEMLMYELEQQSANIEIMNDLGVLMRSEDEKGVDKLNDIYHKAMSLPSRSSTVKTLLDALKTAIGLEREALGITDRTPGSDDDPLSRIIKAVQGSALKPVSLIEGESEIVPND